ncbi:hypothetical protein R3P38DRAFT_3389337 [Favolaschia claudopus]|uniref:Uncharacterized protein n=1 Tax=Favolaschia claudopus TaxID=2862362 RepID=A0AAW0CZH2_9AGAR
MVFECALDDLMQQVGRQKFVDISTREVIGERLLEGLEELTATESTYHNISSYPKIIPHDTRIEALNQQLSLSPVSAPPPKRRKSAAAAPPVEPRNPLADRETRPENPGLPDAPRPKRTPEEVKADEEKKAAAIAEIERKRAAAIAAVTALDLELDAAQEEEQTNMIYGLGDLPVDMDVDEDEDQPILSVSDEDFARIEDDDAYRTGSEDGEKAAPVKKKKKPARGETRAAVESATQAQKKKTVVKKKGVQNSDAAAASRKAGVSKAWLKTQAATKTVSKPADADDNDDGPAGVDLGGLDDEDAGAVRPAADAGSKAARQNNTVAICISSDDETPRRRPEEQKKTKVVTRPSVKAERAAKLPALSFVKSSPATVKHESSDGSFTPSSAVDIKGLPGFIGNSWTPVFLPVLYNAFYLSVDPMTVGFVGNDAKNPGKDAAAFIQSVLDEVYPGNTWVVKWGDAVCSKAVSRIGDRRSAISKAAALIVQREFEGEKYYRALDIPIPGAHVRDTVAIAVDAHDAIRSNGSAFYKTPTPTAVSKLKREDPRYIKPTGYLESKIIIELVSQYIKGVDFGLVVDAAGEENLDTSGLPVGLLGMCAAAVERAYKMYVTGERVKPPDFSAANYGTAVAGFIQSILKFRRSRWDSILNQCGAQIEERASKSSANGPDSLDGLREHMYEPSSP